MQEEKKKEIQSLAQLPQVQYSIFPGWNHLMKNSFYSGNQIESRRRRSNMDSSISSITSQLQGLSADVNKLKQEIQYSTPGYNGTTGPSGYNGTTGPSGPAGANGNDGLSGPPGTSGAKGERGDPGADGIKGDTGSPGAKGDRGDRGYNGAIGPPGANGNDGRSGPPGPPGDTGTLTGDCQSLTSSDSSIVPNISPFYKQLVTWGDAPDFTHTVTKSWDRDKESLTFPGYYEFATPVRSNNLANWRVTGGLLNGAALIGGSWWNQGISRNPNIKLDKALFTLYANQSDYNVQFGVPVWCIKKSRSSDNRYLLFLWNPDDDLSEAGKMLASEIELTMFHESARGGRLRATSVASLYTSGNVDRNEAVALCETVDTSDFLDTTSNPADWKLWDNTYGFYKSHHNGQALIRVHGLQVSNCPQ